MIVPVKVTLLTNLVAPYRFASYCALHQRACNAGGALTVICTSNTEPQRNWPERTPPFSQQHLRGLHVHLGENRLLTIPSGISDAVRSTAPDVLVLVGFGIAQWRACNWAAKAGIPVIVQFDGWSGSDDIYSNPIRRYIRRHMLQKADGFIAASMLGRHWFELQGVSDNRILISPIPISFSVNGDAELQSHRRFDDREYDLLWCGRTTTRKGFGCFLEIASALITSGTISKIGIIGCIDMDRTKSELQNFGLPDQIDLYPQLHPDQLPAFLANSKLCLFPSQNDAYGLGVIEAISCGAVALASDAVGCAPDMLDPDEILSSNGLADWVRACQRLLDNPAIWQQTRQNQASRITQNTPTHHAETLWQAINQAVQKPAGVRQWN